MSCGACDSVSAAQQSSTQSQIQISLYAKQLSTQKQVGEAMVGLLEAAAQLSKELGKGESFDAQA